ncbi:MAG: PaaI family thioesterase [Bacteroidales bacterium]|nr:PaaI family thioesterase [Bacteroidales bacterium]
MGSTSQQNLTEWARRCFADDRYATQATGAVVDSAGASGRQGSARCRLALQPHHRNARGAVMGGVYYTLADFAAAIAMNAGEAATGELHWVSLESSVHFLAQPRGDTLEASARCLHHGTTTCLYEVCVSEQQRLLARVEVRGVRTP